MADAQLQIALKLVDQATAQMRQAMGTTERALKRVDAATQTLNKHLGFLRKAIGFVAGAYIVHRLVKWGEELARVADQYQFLSSRLQLVSSSTEEFHSIQEDLFQVAQQIRASYEATVETYVRMANATKDLGVSSSDLLKVVQVLNEAIVVSGASTQEAQAALIQLSQAMASGRLQGDELRSVLEQLPVVGRMIADYLRVPFGQIRNLAKEGKITTEVMVKAILAHADEIQTKFSQVPITVGQSFQVLHNSWQRLLGESVRLAGSFDAVKAAALAIAKSFDQIRTGELTEGFKTLGEVASSAFIAMTYGAEYAIKAFLGFKTIIQGTTWLVSEFYILFLKWKDAAVAFSAITGNMPSREAYKERLKIAKELEIAKQARDYIKQDISKTVEEIESIGHLAEKVRENFRREMASLQNARRQAQKESYHAKAFSETLPMLPPMLSLPDNKLQALRKEYEQIWLASLPEPQRIIERVKLRYRHMKESLAEIFKLNKEDLEKLGIAQEDFNEILARLTVREQEEISAIQSKQQSEMLKQQKALAESHIRYALSQIDFLYKTGKLSKIEAINAQIVKYHELLKLQQQALGQLDRVKDATAWLEQSQQIDQTRQRIVELQKQLQELTGTFVEGFQYGLSKWLDEVQSHFQQGQYLAQQTADAMQQAFSNYFFDVMRGKLKSFWDYLEGFLVAVERALANILAAQAANQIVGLAKSLFGGLFGGPAAKASPPKKHKGGYVTKYHFGGLAYDEVPAILQQGEYVVSRKGVEFLDKINRGQLPVASPKISVQVNVHNESSFPVKAVHKGTYFDGREIVTNIILQDFHENGPIRQAFLREVR